jgi:hypothetical protein
MEKLTIAAAGSDKEIQTKFGLKKKQGIQFKEYGTLWHDVWGGGRKVGEVLEGTRSSREWEGKTYWDFKLPKKDDKTNEQMFQLENRVRKLEEWQKSLTTVKRRESDMKTSNGDPIPFPMDEDPFEGM